MKRGNEEIGRHLHLWHRNPVENEDSHTKWGVLVDQIIDSLIVGAIAGISTYVAAGAAASVKSAVLAGIMTFLIKLKDYRKIE